VHAFEIPVQFDGEHAADWRSRVGQPLPVCAEDFMAGPLLPYRAVNAETLWCFLASGCAGIRGMYVVKRIMGVPGDRIHLRNGVVTATARRERTLLAA